MLAFSEHVTYLAAARSNLTGNLPDISGHELEDSLQTLDLSRNWIRKVEGLFVASVLVLSYNPNITFAEGVLRAAIQREITVRLRGIELNSADAIKAFSELLPSLNTSRTTLVDKGFVCYDLGDTVLQVTPGLFLRDQLCHCKQGFAQLDKSYPDAFKFQTQTPIDPDKYQKANSCAYPKPSPNRLAGQDQGACTQLASGANPKAHVWAVRKAILQQTYCCTKQMFLVAVSWRC